MSKIPCSEEDLNHQVKGPERRRFTAGLDSQGRCLAEILVSELNANPLNEVGREKGIWTERAEYIRKGIVLEKYLCVWEIAQTLA